MTGRVKALMTAVICCVCAGTMAWGRDGGAKLGLKDVEKHLDAGMKLAYAFDPMTGGGSSKKVTYVKDNSATIRGDVQKIAYLVEGTDKAGKSHWLCVFMDAFTKDVKKVGVPTAESGAFFQMEVKNLRVMGNVPGVKNGVYADGNIEFWPCNYLMTRSLGLEKADDDKYDCDDFPVMPYDKPGLGSMQVHLGKEGITLFAYNHFSAGVNADFGMGNSQRGQSDWSFQSNLSRDYKTASIKVYVSVK